MIISVNWLKKFVDIDLPVDELVSLIGERLVEVEGTEDLSEKYKDVVVAKVISAEHMEGSDHLNVVIIDDGGKVDGIDRDENGYVQVVCGAPNVRAGISVAWLPPKSVVPETYGTGEPFVLEARPLRGYISNGMIASARELDLYDEHDGILEIDKEAAPGSSFAELYELNDVLIDIENKSLTHRPDAFGVIGFAREVAGIQGKQFNTPDWLKDVNTSVAGDASGFDLPSIDIESSELSKRFQLMVIDGVTEDAKSDIQMQTYLSRSGTRPINAMVDISNYLMLLTGQPTHMYDYNKLKSAAGGDFTVGVRLANNGETLTLLDGKEISLDESDILITAGGKPVGLAGIMGGQSTMVDASTKTVALEVATFDLYHMRSSQMRHGIFSEAVTRYTKGVPAELGRPVLSEAVKMATEVIGGRPVGEPVDNYPGLVESPEVKIESSKVNGLLGTQFAAEDIASILGNVEFDVKFDDDLDGVVKVPYWRNDINIPEDVIEEVGRLSGFDTINTTMPARDFTAVHPSRFDDVRNMLRGSLVKAGANEVLTYSFVHGDLIEKSGQDKKNSYRVTNSISPDLQYYRQSLTPSIIQHVNPNIRLGYDSFGLFEVNKVHEKSDGLTDEGVPVEKNSIALVVAKKSFDESKETAYYQAKYLLEFMMKSVGITVELKSMSNSDVEVTARESMFEPKRSAFVFDENGQLLGVVGEYKRSIAKVFKLPDYAAGFELSVDAIVSDAPLVPVSYSAISKYPKVERDVCFKVLDQVSYSAVYAAAADSLADEEIEYSVEPLDLYSPDGEGTKNITLRIVLTSHKQTMTSADVAVVIDRVIDKVIKETDGEVV